MFSRPRSLKERCTWSMEKPHIPASAETMSEYWLHKTGTKQAVLDTVRRASWGKKIKNGSFASDLRFLHISCYAIKIPGEIV